MTASADYIRAHQDEWVALLADLVRIPSAYEDEAAVTGFVADWLRRHGFSPVAVPVEPAAMDAHPDAQLPISRMAGRNNLVVRLPGSGGGRSLIMEAHLDIQPAGDPALWSHLPFAAAIDSATGAMYGRGTMDNKAGVAILLGLLKTIKATDLRLSGDLIFQFVIEDETTGNGTLACVEAGFKADGVVLVDGTRPDKACVAHAGNMEFSLAVEGKSASVSVSHMGVNAAEALCRILLDMRQNIHRLNEGRQGAWREYPSPYQFVVHGLASDAPRFCVPDTAQARCFVTFPPPHSVADIKSLMEAVASEAAAGLGCRSLVFDWGRFALEPVEGAWQPLIDCLQRALAACHMPPLTPSPSTGLSDMRHFVSRGMPCVLYGPGRGYNPHRPDEHFMLEDLPRMMAVYLALAEEWCGT
jgi:acetylornithine deacetylase